MTDEDWMGDADPNNVAGSGADAAPPGGPSQIAPGVWAGDFVNGNGALGIRVDPEAQAVEGAEPATGAAAPDDAGWGAPTPPPDGTDIYQWGRHLGDQGIAYQIKDGKISVFETPEQTPDGPRYRAVDTVEYVPGQTSDQPKDWRQYAATGMIPDQDLSHPVYQNLDAYRTAIDYLRRSPLAGSALDGFGPTGIPVVMVEDKQDRFAGTTKGGGPSGVVYWDPRAGLLTTDRTRNPISGIFPNPFDPVSSQSSYHGLQSPALGLIHEIGHAIDFWKDPIGHFDRGQQFRGNGWNDQEEERNISQFETPIAEWLGEPTRTNHSASGLPRTSDPTAHRPGRTPTK